MFDSLNNAYPDEKGYNGCLRDEKTINKYKEKVKSLALSCSLSHKELEFNKAVTILGLRDKNYHKEIQTNLQNWGRVFCDKDTSISLVSSYCNYTHMDTKFIESEKFNISSHKMKDLSKLLLSHYINYCRQFKFNDSRLKLLNCESEFCDLAPKYASTNKKNFRLPYKIGETVYVDGNLTRKRALEKFKNAAERLGVNLGFMNITLN
jgi:hypothetical protein